MKKLIINQETGNPTIEVVGDGTATGVKVDTGVFIITTSFSVEGKHVFSSRISPDADLSSGDLVGWVSGENEITLVNWASASGFPADFINNVAILIV